MKRILFFLFFGILCNLNAQILNPSHWSFTSKRTDVHNAELLVTVSLDEGWHLYSQFIEEGGPVKTSFRFEPSTDYELQGSVLEHPQAKSAFDKNFNMLISWHEKKVVFIQKIKIKQNKNIQIKGSVEFMVCNDTQCLPPTQQEFSILLTPSSQERSVIATPSSATTLPPRIEAVVSKYDTVSNEPIKMEFWSVFIAGFLGGLAAFFMPCIFPMLPLTISFFTKKAQGNRRKAMGLVLIYGISIVVIYVMLGIGITILLGSDALNDLASNGIFNMLFFILLVVFSASFLGAFEITLPNSWVNKIDVQSDRGGMIGIFFMAFTLALVSFSCTGPIIGTLLVETASTGAVLSPAIGMLGFSLALALPFTFFAAFPTVLHSLPQSGSWLNSIKVSLGFLELALSLKFFSNVDLAYHWNLLNREVYLTLWIVIFLLWGLYLLGKIRFSHDDTLQYISVPRAFLAVIVLSFTLYLVPGLWGASLVPLSGFLPPQHTQQFNIYKDNQVVPSSFHRKYENQFHAPHNLDVFFDYEEGLVYARQVHKPILLDFTGHSCVNCRKMEASVWSDSKVLQHLKNDFVIISLYVDDKTDLPESEQYISRFSGKKIITLGNKWSEFQARKFGSNAQPYYVILNEKEQVLSPPKTFDLDVDEYVAFLEEAITLFKRN